MLPFDLEENAIIADKYRVVRPLGAGWEGEVYLVSELGTGIERAVKLFYPQRNKKKSASKRYARMLHKLRNLPTLIQYHAHEEVMIHDQLVVALISEYIEG
ncbi:MAG: serine/threonine protein kinase, partial [Bdellovibrionales bacterium]|nr:serine/threonine protein kinase [Bdellovibrionales bacterium]